MRIPDNLKSDLYAVRNFIPDKHGDFFTEKASEESISRLIDFIVLNQPKYGWPSRIVTSAEKGGVIALWAGLVNPDELLSTYEPWRFELEIWNDETWGYTARTLTECEYEEEDIPLSELHEHVITDVLKRINAV